MIRLTVLRHDLLHCILGAAWLLGCAHSQQNEARLPVGKARAPTSATAQVRQFKTSPGALLVSAHLRTTCGLSQLSAPGEEGDFNGDLLRIQAMSALDNVAVCLLQGPLKNTTLTMTAYTDARDTGTYNQKLGEMRARSVSDYLSFRGVPKSRLKLISLLKRDERADASRIRHPARNVELGVARDASSSP